MKRILAMFSVCALVCFVSQTPQPIKECEKHTEIVETETIHYLTNEDFEKVYFDLTLFKEN